MLKKSAPRVLVVDDEALIRWSLAEMLGERGYVVTEAADAAMALGGHPAGAQSRSTWCCSTIGCRTRPTFGCSKPSAALRRRSQVIMITAHNSPELAQGAAALGAYRVISKPFEVESLAALVNQARIAGSGD